MQENRQAMPEKLDQTVADASDSPVCPGTLTRCMNCRKAVEASMSRIAGRKLRRARKSDECSVARCVAFLRRVPDEPMRLHLASMAWWRFSADNDGVAAPLLKMMRALYARTSMPEPCSDYMHRALRTLSPLTPLQLATWFGCDSLYQMAAVFTPDRPVVVGRYCAKCALYKQGCTAYNVIGADDCPLWEDEFIQQIARVVTKTGGWRDPCKGVANDGRK